MKLQLSKDAEKYFDKAPKNLQEKFAEAFRKILRGEDDIQPLRGETKLFRYKMFHYRIVFLVEIAEDLVRIVKIGARGDVYKK